MSRPDWIPGPIQEEEERIRGGQVTILSHLAAQEQDRVTKLEALIAELKARQEELLAALTKQGKDCARCKNWHRIGCYHFLADSWEHEKWEDDDCDDACSEARDAIAEAKEEEA